VADKDGKIVKRMEWTDATQLEQFLDSLLGEQTPP
jgi:hypothetical protein